MKRGVEEKTRSMCDALVQARQRVELGLCDVGGQAALASAWWSKLKETYRTRPGSARERWVEQHHPQLHAELLAWREHRESVETVEERRKLVRPFWRSAAECLEIMIHTRRAPSQGSGCRTEVGLAKWLSRWSQDHRWAGVSKDDDRRLVSMELRALAEALRSEEEVAVLGACQKLGAWMSLPAYAAIVREALRMESGEKVWAQRIEEGERRRVPFWRVQGPGADVERGS